MTLQYSIYLHIPFCRHRCAYCDFNTYAGQETSIPLYVHALIQEIEAVSSSAPEPIHVRAASLNTVWISSSSITTVFSQGVLWKGADHIRFAG